MIGRDEDPTVAVGIGVALYFVPPFVWTLRALWNLVAALVEPAAAV